MHRESIYKNYKPEVLDPGNFDSPCYWFVFCLDTNKMLIRIDNNNYSIPLLKNMQELNISPVRIQYLGLLHGIGCYSGELPPDIIVPEGMSLMSLRSLFGIIDEDLYLLAGKAYQIASWDQTHQYCGRCGSATTQNPDERAKKCPQCGFISYPRICPSIIVAVLNDKKILLAHAKGFKDNMYSIIAGFLELGETLEDCVKREVLEEVGISIKNIRYFGSQPWPYPNSMMIGFIADYDNGHITVDGKEIESADWFDIDNLPKIPDKISIAREIIDCCIHGEAAK